MLGSKQYVEWKTNSASFLWLYGIPGCGKTILSSTVIEDVLRRCSEDPQNRVLAYFYFDFNDPEKQSSELMLGSLIIQFAGHCIRMPTALESLFSACMNGQRRPSSGELLETLQQLIKEFHIAYIVLDALDESNDRAELLQTLINITGQQAENLHVLVTSRQEKDINDSLKSSVDKMASICLQSAIVDEDIRSLVRHRLLVDRRLTRWRENIEVQQEVEKALMQKAQGMWVLFLVHRISKYVKSS